MDWDDYWIKNNQNNLYSIVAKIYRKLIFKRMLKHYFTKYFHKKDVILHAGCGSGQVDEDLAKEYKIVAFDLSATALNLYKKNVPQVKFRLKGTISALPFLDNSFDGVYNLGVFEHFDRREIEKSLLEIKRVLKNNGRAVIFWPPEFGLTVIFLKIVHFIMCLFGKKDYEVHPSEISRLKSKKEALIIFEKAGFEVERVNFNILDFFTMIAIVARKI